jgi:formamidopyrimidine-DNA glycosylase
MPELPEVECVVRGLAPHLPGFTIEKVELLNASTAQGSLVKPSTLTGRTFERIWRRAKYIMIDLDNGMGMSVHLRMTGWLGLLEPDAEVDKFARMIFHVKNARGEQRKLVFRDIRKFGRIWCGPREKLMKKKELAKLGPEPLELAADDFIERLKNKRGRMKSVLLDQEFLAGLGNIYVDESLFESGIHPLREAHKIKPDQARKLHGKIQEVLNRALQSGGSTLRDYLHPDGTEGWFQREIKVYGREDEPCKTCKTKITRIVVGQRGTWFCGKCQKR